MGELPFSASLFLDGPCNTLIPQTNNHDNS